MTVHTLEDANLAMAKVARALQLPEGSVEVCAVDEAYEITVRDRRFCVVSYPGEAVDLAPVIAAAIQLGMDRGVEIEEEQNAAIAVGRAA